MTTDQTAAIERLRAEFPAGSTAWTILRHVSQSGMSRSISIVSVTDGEPMDVSWLLAQAGIAKRSRRHDGVDRSGCGMDMGFDLVYSMSQVIHGNGYAVSHRWL